MISLAFFGPMPWIYCNAIMTRLLVGMLTPAMRATVNHSFCRPVDGGQRSRGRFANDNATPSPSRRARYRSTSQLGCGLLMDSTSFRQPPPGVPLRCADVRGSPAPRPRLAVFALAFMDLAGLAAAVFGFRAAGRDIFARGFLFTACRSARSIALDTSGIVTMPSTERSTLWSW